MNNTETKKTAENAVEKKVLLNDRDELNRSRKPRIKDYQLNYGVNQKKRAIERIETLLETIKEIPTETYEYGYYGFNTALENLESKVGDLLSKGEDKGHEDERGWEDEEDYKKWLDEAEDDEYSEAECE